MNVLPQRGLLLSFTIFAFLAVGVQPFSAIFNPSTRWLFLLVLALALLALGRLPLPFKSPIAWALLASILWNFATSLWSEVPELSLMKSTAFALATWTFLSGGMALGQQTEDKSYLAYLLPVVGLALFAVFTGVGGGASPDESGPDLFQGATGNPNFLGILIAMSLPYLLYLVLSSRQGFRFRRILAGGLLALLLPALWASGSRASMLCALTLAMFAAWSIGSRRFVKIAVFGGALALAILVMLPAITGSVYTKIIKDTDTSVDVFNTRLRPWELSYEGALEGGMTGLGYGVSAGYTEFEGGLNAISYGREKGNSQLAIWEETGLIGLGLYAVLAATIILQFWSWMRRSSDTDKRLQIGMLAGVLTGIMIQSVFEAWWTSPGSIESAFFWAGVGVSAAIGLSPQDAPKGAMVPSGRMSTASSV